MQTDWTLRKILQIKWWEKEEHKVKVVQQTCEDTEYYVYFASEEGENRLYD